MRGTNLIRLMEWFSVVRPLCVLRMNLHGELTEDLEWKNRQGLEWKGFRLLAVTALFLNERGAAGVIGAELHKKHPLYRPNEGYEGCEGCEGDEATASRLRGPWRAFQRCSWRRTFPEGAGDAI